MNICSDGHEEVAFDGRKCPACDAIEIYQDREKKLLERIDAIKETSDGQEEIIWFLKEDKIELHTQIRDLEAIINNLP
jgi:hypothetical protein